MTVNLHTKYGRSADRWLDAAPRGWPVIRLRFSAKINPSRSEVNGIPGDTEVSFVPMESVGEYGGLCLEQVKPLDEVSTGYTYFREGDIVVAKITPCFENGKGSIAEGLENGLGFGTTELHVLRPSADMDRRFLFYLTISHAFRSIGAAYMYGAGGQKRVPDDFIRNFSHPIPPLGDQRAIAAFLDRETARIDALIEKKRRQIELLQEKRAALISHAVTKGLDPTAPMKGSGIRWLGEVPEHWNVVQLRRIASDLQTGPFGSQLHASDYVDGGIPVINPANIQNGVVVPDDRTTVTEDTFARLRRHALEEGDIVFGRRGEMGRSALIGEAERGFLCGTGSIRARLRTSAAHPRFVALFLQHSGVHDHLVLESVGSTMDNLNTTIIGRIPIALPPTQEQLDIAKQIHRDQARIDHLTAKVNISIDRLREYRSALISAAVTGKIKVNDECGVMNDE